MNNRVAKILLLVAIVLFSVSNLFAQEIVLQYKCAEPNTSSNQIRPHLQLVNTGLSEIDMSAVKIRYYYSLEDPAPQQFNVDWAAIGTGYLTGEFVQTDGNNYYLEIGFDQMTPGLQPGSSTGDMMIRFHKTDWTFVDQGDDYSFDASYSSYADFTNALVLYDGVEVYGTSPGSGPLNDPPSCSLTAPADGSVFNISETVVLTASAEDTDGTIDQVDFYVNDVLVGSDATAPYSFDWQATAIGGYTVYAVAYDNDGAGTNSEAADITIKDPSINTPPTVSFVSPTDNRIYEVGSTVMVQVTAEDTDGTVDTVDLYIDSELVQSYTTEPYTYEFTATESLIGNHEIMVTATDNGGASTSSTVTITIKEEGSQVDNPYSSVIRLNQAGYHPLDTAKTAVVAGMTGTFTVHNLSNDAEVLSGTLTSLGTDSENGESLYIADFSALETAGTYYVKVGSEKSPKFDIKSDLFNELVYYTLRVYGANRCGNYDSWIHEPCHLLDGSIRGDDKAGTLQGGWHDCGDHVKFGGTMGYASAMMLYSYMAWPDSFGDVYSMSYDGTYKTPSPDGIPDPLNEVKVATDYYLNMYDASVEDGLVSNNEMYYQVGDGDEDHTWWHLPQFQDDFGQAKGGAPREVFTDIGSDIAGRWSASLSMMSILYAEYDQQYADRCLDAAKVYYEVGVAVYGETRSTGGKGYYQMDTRCDDDLALAALMLYKATNDDYYLNNTTGVQYWMARENKWQFVSYYVLSYPNVFALVLHGYYPHAATEDNGPSEIDTIIVTKQECIDWLKMDGAGKGDDLYGRRWSYDWGSCRYFMGVAATAAMAHDLDPADDSMLQVARDQLDWVFGRNQFGMSFVIGNQEDNWLTKYPEHPHHRAANPEGENVPELPTYEATELTGATIGGPENHTEFVDEWDHYTSTETGIDYWAGTYFTAAYLIDYYKNK